MWTTRKLCAAAGQHIEREVRQVFGPSRSHAQSQAKSSVPTTAISLIGFVVLLMVYGGMMGSYGLWGGEGVFGAGGLQVLYSAIKVPLLIGVTFLLSLPSLFVFYALAGLAEEFRQVLSLLLSTQMVFAFVLISLAPFMLLFYASSVAYVQGVLINGVAFALAAVVWHHILRKRFRAFVAINRRHTFLLRLWFVLYTFIGVQMGWTLRPFVGSPNAEVQFFRSDGWGNAWVEVWEMVLSSIDTLIGG